MYKIRHELLASYLVCHGYWRDTQIISHSYSHTAFSKFHRQSRTELPLSAAVPFVPRLVLSHRRPRTTYRHPTTSSHLQANQLANAVVGRFCPGETTLITAFVLFGRDHRPPVFD